MNGYDVPEMHRRLVGDEVRTRAFYDSIMATVQAGSTVMDMGAGSGILSLFAAQAGASRVYAIERAPGAAALARRLVAANGFSSVIEIVEADAEAVQLPEQVDMLVSEWMGAYGVDENMLAPMLVARDRWLKPGGSLVPSSVTAWLAPVHHRAAAEATVFRLGEYDLDLSALAPHSLDEAIWLPTGAAVEDLRAKPQQLWTTDCATMPEADARTPYAAELTFELTGEGVNGVVVWFSAEMPGAGTLSNGPGQPLTHWGQFLFPITNAHRCKAGDKIAVGFHNVPWGVLGSQHIWASRVEGQPFEVHDTRRSQRPAWTPPWRVYMAG